MNDGKFHLPTQRKKSTSSTAVVRLNEDAWGVLVEMFNDSTLSMSEIASRAIIYAREHAVYDKEE